MKKKEDEIIANFSEMSEEKMWSLLAQLVDTDFFMAIQKFIRKKDMEAITVLASNDPFVAPTVAARAQGIRQGVYFLEQSALAEKKRIEEKTKEEREK